MKRIIIVEDDPRIQDSTGLIFKQPEYEVTVFRDGNHILSGDFELPDIFLIDKQLPGVDGLELCKHLKQQRDTRKIPVIIMSASPQVQTHPTIVKAEGFLEKPFTINEVRELVKRYLVQYDK